MKRFLRGVVGVLAVIAPLALGGCGRAEVRVLRGNHSMGQGRYGQAIIHYMRARALAGESSTIDYDLAGVYHALGEVEAAEEALLGALEGEGRELRFRAHYNLGSVYYELGRFAEAVQQYRQALILAPDDVETKINLELTLKRLQTQSPVPETQATQGGDQPTAATRRVLDLAREQERMQWQPQTDTDASESSQDW